MLMSCAGNANIHLMTADERQILRIELRDWDDNVRYADYDNFRVGPEHSQYRLESVGKYSGNAGQYMTRKQIALIIRVG